MKWEGKGRKYARRQSDLGNIRRSTWPTQQQWMIGNIAEVILLPRLCLISWPPLPPPWAQRRVMLAWTIWHQGTISLYNDSMACVNKSNTGPGFSFILPHLTNIKEHWPHRLTGWCGLPVEVALFTTKNALTSVRIPKTSSAFHRSIPNIGHNGKVVCQLAASGHYWADPNIINYISILYCSLVNTDL